MSMAICSSLLALQREFYSINQKQFSNLPCSNAVDRVENEKSCILNLYSGDSEKDDGEVVEQPEKEKQMLKTAELEGWRTYKLARVNQFNK